MCVITINFTNVAGCDFDDRPVFVQIKPGNTRATFDFDIIDDDVHESFESFNLVIDDVTSPATNCDSYRTTITIRDNEPRKHLYKVLCFGIQHSLLLFVKYITVNVNCLMG